MSSAQYVTQLVCQFLLPAASVLVMATLPGSDGGSAISTNEVVTALAACVVATATASHRGRLASAGCAGTSAAGSGPDTAGPQGTDRR
jgi:hypothetical protein